MDPVLVLLLRDLLYGVSLTDAATANLNLMSALRLNAGPAADYQNGVEHIVNALQNAARSLCKVKQ